MPSGLAEGQGSTQQALNLDASKNLGKVRIVLKGLSRIKSTTVYPDLEHVKNARTVKELFLFLEESHWRLKKLGLFNTVVSTLERGVRHGDVDVVFDFEEKPSSYSIGVNTNSKADVNLELKGDILGLFGSSNSMSLKINTAGSRDNELTGSYHIPRIFGLPKFTGIFRLFTSQSDLTNYSSFSTRSKGLKFCLSDAENHNKFIWEAAIQDIYSSFNDKRRASESILRASGRSLKNSLSYLYVSDEIEGEHMPIGGQCTQIKVEAGLPGGDRRFLKFDYSMLFASYIKNTLIMHLNLSAGFMCGLGTTTNWSSVLDRFHFTGGSGAGSAFRGFGYHGVGPHSFCSIFDPEKKEWNKAPDYLGGDYYGNLQISLHYPLKLNISPMPMIFCFANIGSICASVDRARIYVQALRDLRASVGTGFSTPISKGCWVEAFFAAPLLYAPSDTINRFQLGFRLKHDIN